MRPMTVDLSMSQERKSNRENLVGDKKKSLFVEKNHYLMLDTLTSTKYVLLR